MKTRCNGSVRITYTTVKKIIKRVKIINALINSKVNEEEVIAKDVKTRLED